MPKKSALGIMSVENSEYFPYGKQVFFFEDMMNAYPQKSFDVFFFSPLDWSPGKSILKGYKFHRGKWIKVIEEIPELIYDRAFSKDNLQKIQLEDCRAALTKSNKRILNPFGLVDLLNNKIEFHKFLIEQQIPTVGTFDFAALEDKSIFKTIKSNRIYVKPSFGSRGQGIFVIQKRKDTYTLFDNLGKGKNYQSYTWLYKALLRQVETPSRYFAQEEAKIIRYKNAPFDIRVLIQNYGNDYKVTGLGARIGAKNSMTSNLNSGGAALPLSVLSEFFQKKYGRNIKEEEKSMKQICIACCEKLKASYGEFLEIGFDILCTKDKGPIIIEGNAKPSRWIFNVIADYLEEQNKSATKYKNLRKETVKVPLLFTEYLLRN